MLSIQEILVEYTRCLENPVYAIETYLETYDKTQQGFVQFLLFPRQIELIYSYEKFRQNLVTKPRQAGVSTTTAAYHAVKIAFGDPENPEAILILANKQDMAQEFLDKIKVFLTQIPRWAWGEEYYGDAEKDKKSIFITDSKKEIKLPNGCRVRAVATSKDALRGYTPTHLIMDECAFIDNGAIVFSTAMASLGTGGKCTLISTPNGIDELYYKTYEQSKAAKNSFKITEMRWFEDLRYNKDLRWLKDDEVIKEIEFTFESYEKMIADGYKPTSSWYEEMCRSLNNNAKQIAQELDVSFVGSGGNVVLDEYIVYHETFNVKDPVQVLGHEEECWIWEKPQIGHQYAAGVDVARGDGLDYSTISIIDVTTMEQVLEYQAKIQPDLLAQKVSDYCSPYKAYVIVDITGGIGTATILKLIEMEYPDIHYDDKKSNVLTRKNELEAHSKDNKTPGFSIGAGNRLHMISNLEEKIRENIIKIRSRRLTAELKTFIFRNGKPDHMSGYHDDLIIAIAMVLFVIEYSFKNLKKLESQTKAILNSWVTSSNVTQPKDATTQQIKNSQYMPQTSKSIQNNKNQHLWLFAKSK